MITKVLVFSIFLGTACLASSSFPKGFVFGASSAAYQIEGSWNVSGKGESIWDRLTHTQPYLIADGSTGDVACDSYRLYRQDVQMAVDLGLNFYRFSITWSRILPSGFNNEINKDGVEYYNNLINELLLHGIEPVVTIFHNDLPQRLQNLGGWTNPLIVDWFGVYARVLYTLYGDRVKTWLTINEPVVTCDQAYNSGDTAPAITDPDMVATYMCNKNILMAHAMAWRIYDNEFKSKYGGQVSMVNHLIWYEAASEEYEELAELTNQYCTGRYSHPIYSKEGGWPRSIEKVVAKNSKKKGYPQSRLPKFTQEEIDFVKGTYDFYALNHYTSRLVSKAKPGEQLEPFIFGDAPELGAKLTTGDWPADATGAVLSNPEGMRNILKWLKTNYGDLKILITENGCTSSGDFEDDDKIQYIKDYMEQMLLAIEEDGVNVMGYAVWSLMDDFEWTSGYTSKYGLYHVNFTDPQRARTPHRSARWYANVIQSNSLDVNCE